MKPATFARTRSVLFLIPSLQGGGAERVIATLLRHLDRTKFRLTVAVVDGRDAAFRGDLPDDVEFIDLRSTRVRYALPKLGKLVWERRPDMVFSTLGHLNLVLGAMRAVLPSSTTFVAREAGIVTEANRTRNHARLWSSAYRHLYRRLDMIVCQSAYMQDDLVQNFGLPPEKSRVIHNPVDIHRIRRLALESPATGFEGRHPRRPDSTIHLVAAGRLSNEKGFDILLEALALCRDEKLKLTILGQGPLRGELEQLARNLGVDAQVTFAGFQKNPYPFLAQADMFVLSSRDEGFPNVVLEAMACGTPVASTPARGGVPEILRGVPGCALAEDITPDALARAIQSVPIARLSPSVVDHYDAGKIASEYSRAFSEILAAFGPD